MNELDLNKVRKAWQGASAGDVVHGLNHPEDYPPEVFALVQEEARRRGLRADSVEASAPPTFAAVRRTHPRCAPGARRTDQYGDLFRAATVRERTISTATVKRPEGSTANA